MSEVRATDPSAVVDADSFEAHGEELLALADAAIDYGLVHGCPPLIETAAYPPALQAHRAAFVTLLDERGELRGCTGTIEPHRPLALEVSADAFNAAFRDPRFLPLTAAEREGLACKLSILTPPEPFRFDDEAELVAQLRPGVDGVAVEGESGHGTFLPAVWEHFPDPVEFWLALKQKAGLPLDGLPGGVGVFRYEAVELSGKR